MKKDELLDRVVTVLAESFQLEASEIGPTTHLFEELDLDSIDAIDLMVGVQQETGVKLREEELMRIRVVQDVVDALHRNLQGSGAS